MGSTAYANVPGGDEDRPRGFGFECRFEALGDKGKLPDVVCEVEGRVCEGFDLASGDNRCHDGEDAMKVRCTDGFALRTDEVRVRKLENELQIFGASHGKRALVTIEEFGHRSEGREHDRTFDAELVTMVDEETPVRLQGECELDFLRQHD
ncbi:MAG: hypothetical protein A2X94_15335 [Bdellovibrionales bacterium GWB1_55_8]|nr:MAG: hypothetical protein A2X94_15335 [Bdellovibrionales bacterium GWB1_55_8]